MNVPPLPVAGCLNLCTAIIQQLVLAKYNKQECDSLGGLIQCIRDFLKKLPAESVSAEGTELLSRLYEVLNSSNTFLSKVTQQGPLTSLLLARDVREHLHRFNRDLSNCFNMFGTVEKLMLSRQQFEALQTVQNGVKAAELDLKALLLNKELIADKLADAAVAAQQHRMHPEQLQSLLLHQLSAVDEISNLTPEELLAELQALQLDALYGGDKPKASRKGNLLGDRTEDFLVEQICAAYAPKAALANKPLTPAAAPEPADDFLCPISKTVMVNPVILTETAQSYEAANIQRWLDLHDTCPVTKQQLQSKTLIPNYALRSVIQSWVRQHGIRLPAAPVHQPFLAGLSVGASTTPGQVLSGPTANWADAVYSSNHPSAVQDVAHASRSATTLEAVTIGIIGKDVQLEDDDAKQGSVDRLPVQDKVMTGLLPAFTNPTSNPDRSSGSLKQVKGRSRLHCTRTSWAVTLLLLVLAVAGGVGAGVGIHLAKQRKTGASSSQNAGVTPPPGVVPSPAPNVTGERLVQIQIRTCDWFIYDKTMPSAGMCTGGGDFIAFNPQPANSYISRTLTMVFRKQYQCSQLANQSACESADKRLDCSWGSNPEAGYARDDKCYSDLVASWKVLVKHAYYNYMGIPDWLNWTCPNTPADISARCSALATATTSGLSACKADKNCVEETNVKSDGKSSRYCMAKFFLDLTDQENSAWSQNLSSMDPSVVGNCESAVYFRNIFNCKSYNNSEACTRNSWCTWGDKFKLCSVNPYGTDSWGQAVTDKTAACNKWSADNYTCVLSGLQTVDVPAVDIGM